MMSSVFPALVVQEMMKSFTRFVITDLWLITRGQICTGNLEVQSVGHFQLKVSALITFLAVPNFCHTTLPPFPSTPARSFFCTQRRESHSCTRPGMPTLGIAQPSKSHLKFSGGFQSKMEAHDRLANLGNLTVSHHKNNRVITFEPLIYIKGFIPRGTIRGMVQVSLGRW